MAMLVAASADLQSVDRWLSFSASVRWDEHTDSSVVILGNHNRIDMAHARRALAAILRRARHLRRQSWGDDVQAIDHPSCA